MNPLVLTVVTIALVNVLFIWGVTLYREVQHQKERCRDLWVQREELEIHVQVLKKQLENKRGKVEAAAVKSDSPPPSKREIEKIVRSLKMVQKELADG